MCGSTIAAFLGLCSVGIYGWRISADARPTQYCPLWPNYAKERIRLTCAYIGGAVFIAVLTAAVALRSPVVMNFMMGFDPLFMVFGTFFSTAGIAKAIRSVNPYIQCTKALKVRTAGSAMAPLTSFLKNHIKSGLLVIIECVG